jgi:hypothetical protein
MSNLEVKTHEIFLPSFAVSQINNGTVINERIAAEIQLTAGVVQILTEGSAESALETKSDAMMLFTA